MSIFSIDIDKLSKDVLPPQTRSVENVAFIKGLFTQPIRTHNLFVAYLEGAKTTLGALPWAAGSFSKGEYVYYILTGEVFECQADTTAEPTTSTDWLKVLDSFIGVNESQYFDGGNLALTYGLNIRFDTNYVDPPSTSDIYILNEVQGVPMFRVGANESESSSIGANEVESDFITYGATATVAYLFTVWIPAALTATLGADAFKIVRRFVDKYVPAGCLYDVTDY